MKMMTENRLSHGVPGTSVLRMMLLGLSIYLNLEELVRWAEGLKTLLLTDLSD